MDPRVDIFDKSKLPSSKQNLAKAVAILAVSATLMLLLYAVGCGKHHAQAIVLGLAAVWATFAPIWFFLEFYYFYRKAPGEPFDSSWELFKHGQQLGTAVWAGVAATLYALGSSDFLKPLPEVVTCSIVITKSEQSAEPVAVVKCPK